MLPKCFNQDGSNPTLAADNFFCSLIARDPATGWFANVNQPTLNLGDEQKFMTEAATQIKTRTSASGAR